MRNYLDFELNFETMSEFFARAIVSSHRNLYVSF